MLLNAKLEEKKKEHDALLALERLSQEYVRRLEAIDLDCNVMADAGRSMPQNSKFNQRFG